MVCYNRTQSLTQMSISVLISYKMFWNFDWRKLFPLGTPVAERHGQETANSAWTIQRKTKLNTPNDVFSFSDSETEWCQYPEDWHINDNSGNIHKNLDLKNARCYIVLVIELLIKYKSSLSSSLSKWLLINSLFCWKHNYTVSKMLFWHRTDRRMNKYMYRCWRTCEFGTMYMSMVGSAGYSGTAQACRVL